MNGMFASERAICKKRWNRMFGDMMLSHRNLKNMGMSTGEKVIIGCIVVAILWGTGLLSAFGIAPPAALFGEGAGVPSKEESTVANPVQVYVKVNCYMGIGTDEAGLDAGDSDQIVRIYTQAGSFIESATTSSGVATLGKMYWSGTNLLVQARQADVDAADPYVSRAVTRMVPHGASLDTGDTVSIDPIYVRDVSATAPTLKVWDVGGAAISDNSVNYLNTTDNLMTIQISAIDDNTFYGPEDFTDLKTGRQYDGGVFLVWKGTVTQSFSGYKYHWSDPVNVYYIWEVADFLVDDATVSTDDIISIQIATTGSAALVADATVVIDICDIIWLESQLSSTDLIDGGGITPTAITTKVA